MNIQSAINKEVFIPRDERMLVAVEVRRRKRKRVQFLSAGGKGDYKTFICLSVTNRKPPQLLITKVKQFAGSACLVARSQWSVEQLRQVNGINPNKDSPEFDLVFDNTLDQWVSSSAADKCIFVLILYRACQTYWGGKVGGLARTGTQGKVGALRRMSLDAQVSQLEGPREPRAPVGPRSRTLTLRRKSCVPPRQTEFINCQPKLTREASPMNLVVYRCKAFFNRMKKRMAASRRRPESKGPHPPRSIVGNVVQRVTVAVGERGERLSRSEDKTVELMHKAQQFADTAHKLALKYTK